MLELDLPSLELLPAVNGMSGEVPPTADAARRIRELGEDMWAFLEVERAWAARKDGPKAATAPAAAEEEDTSAGALADAWAQLLFDLSPAYGATAAALAHGFALHPPHFSVAPTRADSHGPPRGARGAGLAATKSPWGGGGHKIARGEGVCLRACLRNRLSAAVAVHQLRIDVRPAPASSTSAPTSPSPDEEDDPGDTINADATFATSPVDVTVPAGGSLDVVLRATPFSEGRFRVSHARWALSPALSVRQSLARPGPFLQRTVKQRATRQRGPDDTLCFDVLPPQPVLHVRMEGGALADAIQWDLPPGSGSSGSSGSGGGSIDGGAAVVHLLQGQVLRTTLVVRNEGTAAAEHVFLKTSHPGLALAAPTPPHAFLQVHAAATQ